MASPGMSRSPASSPPMEKMLLPMPDNTIWVIMNSCRHTDQMYMPSAPKAWSTMLLNP